MTVTCIQDLSEISQGVFELSCLRSDRQTENAINTILIEPRFQLRNKSCKREEKKPEIMYVICM